jgi:hypothetical protein
MTTPPMLPGLVSQGHVEGTTVKDFEDKTMFWTSIPLLSSYEAGGASASSVSDTSDGRSKASGRSHIDSFHGRIAQA